jgi:hypothetical protein
MDMEDEEEGEMDLLPVRLLLGKGNRPQKISTRKRPDALLLLRSSSSGRRDLRRGGEGNGAIPKADATIPHLPTPGPCTQLDAAYEELQQDVVRPPPRERLANKWITDETWKIVDKRTLLRQKGILSQATARSLGREIKARLKADRLLRAKTTASNIEGYLAAGEFVEAWRHLKGWYRSAEDRPPKPCRETLAKQTQERIDLYAARTPHGEMLPFHVNPALVPDAAPTDSEL